MRHYGHKGKVDANQAEIVKGLREAGCSVVSIATVGDGCPDLLVGYNNTNFLLEVKRLGEELNEVEQVWHYQWQGEVVTVHDVESAIAVLIKKLKEVAQ